MRQGLRMKCKRITAGFLALSMAAILALGETGAVLAAEGERLMEKVEAMRADDGFEEATSSDAGMRERSSDVVVNVTASGESEFQSGGTIALDISVKNDTSEVVENGALTFWADGAAEDSAHFEMDESAEDDVELIDGFTLTNDLEGGDGVEAAYSFATPSDAEEWGEDEDVISQSIEGIRLNPGQVYTAHLVFDTDEEVVGQKLRSVKVRFQGQGKTKKVRAEDSFDYTVNGMNIDEIALENEDDVKAGDIVTMGIHSAVFDEESETADAENVLGDLLTASPSDAQQASPSNADSAGIHVSSPSNAAADGAETGDVEFEAGGASYEFEVYNLKIKDFEVDRALNGDEEKLLVCTFEIPKNTAPGVYFGKLTQKVKEKGFTSKSTQGFALVVRADGNVELEGAVAGSGAAVTVSGPAEAFPEADQLVVTAEEVDIDTMDSVREALQAKADAEGIEINAFKALDIRLWADGEEIHEMDGDISVIFKGVELNEKLSIGDAAVAETETESEGETETGGFRGMMRAAGRKLENLKEDLTGADDESKKNIQVWHLDGESMAIEEKPTSVDDANGNVVMGTDHFSIYVVVDMGKPGGQIKVTVEHWGAVETIKGDGTNPSLVQLDTEKDSKGRRYGYHTYDEVYDRHNQKINIITEGVKQIYTSDEIDIPNQKKYDSIEELSKISLTTAEKAKADKNYLISEIWVSDDLANKGKSDWNAGTYTKYEVESDKDGKISSVSADGKNVEGVTLEKDSIIRFLYTEQEAAMVYQPVTFYDHNLSNGNATTGDQKGLNSPNNFNGYTNTNNKFKMGVGQPASGNLSALDRWSSSREELTKNQLLSPLGYLNRGNGYDTVNDVKSDVVFQQDGNRAPDAYPVIVKGIVKDNLDENFNLQYDDRIMQPGFFGEKKSSGIKKFDNYKLGFQRKGDTYILSKVKRGDEVVLKDLEKIKYSAHNGSDEFSTTTGRKKGSDTNIYSNEFWPLDKEKNYPGADKQGYQESDDGKNHNWHFGMRYEFSFQVGDYDGPMNFYFRGDDDFWMFVDGKKVIDLGGIHSAVGQAIDMKKWLEDQDGLDRDAVHRMTIYYMERGGFGSCCYIQYTLPNCVPIESPTVPMTDVTVKKVWDDHDNPARPKTIEVELLRNGNVIDKQTLRGIGDTWSYTWAQLPTVDVNGSGEKYTYQVREIGTVYGYSPTTKNVGDEWTITNTLSPEVKAKVTKVWDDSEDQDGNRPEKVIMQLQWSKDKGKTWEDYPSSDSAYAMSDTDNWSHVFDHLPEYDGDAEVQYRVRELHPTSNKKLNKNDSLPGKRKEAGIDWLYKVTDIKDEVTEPDKQNDYLRGTSTIKNSYTPQKTSRKVKKTWVDVPDYMETSVKVGLYAAGENSSDFELVKDLPNSQDNPVTLEKKSGSVLNAEHVWNNLPKYKNGSLIRYAIYELKEDNSGTVKIGSKGIYTLKGYDYSVDIGDPVAGNSDENKATEITNTLLKAKLRLVKEVQKPENLENEPIDSKYKFMIDLREGDINGSLYTSAALGNEEAPEDFIEIIPPHDGKSFTVQEIVPMEYELVEMTGEWSEGFIKDGQPEFSYNTSGEKNASVTVKPGEDITVTVINKPSHGGYFHHTTSVTNVHQGIIGGFQKKDDYKELPNDKKKDSSPISSGLNAVLPEKPKDNEEDDADTRLI